jgi:hypothetical protein
MASPDILLQILTKIRAMRPDSVFIESLYNHYCNRGGLSRKQLEGLLNKARKIPEFSQANIATLEAIILKKPVKEKAAATITAASAQKDDALEKMLAAILEKYPQHKTALFIKSKLRNNEAIASTTVTEIKKLHKLLIKP